MRFGEMNWRPKLRQFGFAPKGEEWRCWYPGLIASAGEEWYEEVTLSLVERFQMFMGYRERNLRHLMKDFDVYEIMHAEDLFKAVLHMPKPLAEMLDDEQIPRTQNRRRFNPLFGPMPEFHGPLEPNGLHPFEAQYVPAPHGFNSKEIVVQPLMKHIPSLPALPSLTEWMDTLKELTQLHPLSIKLEAE